MGTMKAADLHRIISEAQLFASTDATLPTIGVVKVEIKVDVIRAMATDRFTLGVSKADYQVELPGIGEDWSFALHPAERKQLLTVAKTGRGSEATYREVTIQRAEGGFVAFKFNTGEEVRLRESEDDFPAVMRLFPAPDDLVHSEPVNVQAVDAQHFAKFAKINDGGNGKSTRVKWVSIRTVKNRGQSDQSVQQRPSVCLIGENFVGLIMPIRLPDEDNGRYKLEYPAWF